MQLKSFQLERIRKKNNQESILNGRKNREEREPSEKIETICVKRVEWVLWLDGIDGALMMATVEMAFVDCFEIR